jgi:hypothetical protein
VGTAHPTQKTLRDKMVRPMETSTEKTRSFRPMISGMIRFGGGGLFVCFVFGKTAGIKNIADESLPLFIAMLFFLTILLVGLLVLFPIQVLYFDRKERKNKPPELVTLDDVAGLHSGEFNPNAQLPKWISIPVKIVLWAVVGVFILFITLGLIGLAVSHFIGPEG